MKESYTEFKNTPAAFEMILVEGGIFEMGSNDEEAEKPIHKVRVSSFWMGKFAVTQALWAYVMAGTDKENPSRFKGANHPVESVSYNDIVGEFLPRLKTMTGLAYRLPTEAEWEYAAKGGKYGQKYLFTCAGSNKLEEVGWYGSNENSHQETKRVGLKTPNLLGLYDMSGNVWEWCSDWYGSYPDSTKSITVNPTGPLTGPFRVFRGGSWNFSTQNCHSMIRNSNYPEYRIINVGFRLALSFSAIQ